MKIKILLLSIVLTCSWSWQAKAASDYSQIKKDVNVMSQIIKSALKSDDECRRCSVTVQGKYLAEQGIVFLIHGNRGNYSMIYAGGDHDFNFSFDERDFEALGDIPDMVSDIVASVVPMIPIALESDVTHDIRIVDGTTREELREIRRERRDLEMEIRENEIELIHMDEGRQQQLEDALADLEKEVDKLQSKRQKIEQQAIASREEYQAKRQLRRDEKLAALKAHQELVQGKVLDVFCDYGSTLRSLPGKERITLIFESSSNEDTVMVFNQESVTSCDRSEKGLSSQAITYLF